MSVLSRHVEATAVSLNWKRTVVVEQGRWLSRRTSWKPHGDNVRNLRTVHRTEPDLVGGANMRRAGASMPKSRAYEVMADHTYFEYEEFEWHKYRSYSAKGDNPADVHWPEYTLEPDQRITERRETYHAKFSVTADADADAYVTELDETTWRTLKVGRTYRLKVGLLSDAVQQVSPARDGTHR
ncbi:MAG: hypothetical protein ABSA02_25570 [Trebonia sp.]|jgi:hypothetical protein